jgi:hypothetical protein
MAAAQIFHHRAHVAVELQSVFFASFPNFRENGIK